MSSGYLDQTPWGKHRLKKIAPVVLVPPFWPFEQRQEQNLLNVSFPGLRRKDKRGESDKTEGNELKKQDLEKLGVLNQAVEILPYVITFTKIKIFKRM